MATSDTNDLDAGVTRRGAAPEQKLFGRYTLGKILGRGGMGVVYLAHDDELMRNVAMKFLPDMIVRDREAVEDLKRETRRSLDLTHHHIVRIYDFTQDSDCAAIIMEYVDGESLSAMKVRQDGGCFSISTIQAWLSHFCQAMDYAHRQARVVHRDLKPANLMVNGRGDLKVTDFGISRSMSDSMTRVSMSNSAGTLAYMSPEQALGSPPAVGDDIYAFGATAYDMLTGRPPFFRGNLQVQLETVVPPPMESRRAELGNTGEPIPALWEEVIAACLSKRPQDRPQGMMEIASLLGVGGSTTIGFRPASGRSGSAGGPGTSRTSTTAPVTPTQRATATDPATTPKTDVAPSVPSTSRPPSSSRILQATRREDVMSDYHTPHVTTPPAASPPSATATPQPVTARATPVPPPPEPAPAVEPAPPIEPPPPVDAAPSVEPPPPVEAAPRVELPPPVDLAPAIELPPPVDTAPPVEPEPILEPVAVEAPPPLPVAEALAVEPPPQVVPMEIPQVPPTEKPPVDSEFAATISMPAIELPAAEPPPPTSKEAAPAISMPTPSSYPAKTNVSTKTSYGHAIGSGASRKSSNNLGLILGAVAAFVVAGLLGLWFATKPPGPDPKKAAVTGHIAAANSALEGNDLSTAGREIAAVKSLDPANASLAALQSSLQQKQAAADKAAAEKVAAARAAEQAERDRLAKIEEEKQRLAKIEQDKIRTADLARQQQQQQQQQFDSALTKVDDAIDKRDPATARKNLGLAQQIRPNADEIASRTTRIAALEDELKPKQPETTVEPEKPVADKTPDKPRKSQEKEPVAKTKPKPKHEAEPEPSRPVAQRPPPPAPVSRPTTTTTTPPKRPSNPFGGGAPGG